MAMTAKLRKHKRNVFSALRGGDGGLLVSGPSNLFSVKFLFAIVFELVGTMLFALLGCSCPSNYIPAGNGFTLAVLLYITANVSGGHLNPAVTISTVITGHISALKGAAYVVAQIGGAALGSLIAVGLDSGLSTGGGTGPGCFTPGVAAQSNLPLSTLQAAGWEAIFTFILVSTVYAVAIGKPNFGIVGPGIVGLSLYACAAIGVPLTGASLNPARTLGPLIVFQCYPHAAWAYVVAEVIGGLLAGIVAWPLYGTGPEFLRFVDKAADEGSVRNGKLEDTPSGSSAGDHDHGYTQQDVESGTVTPPAAPERDDDQTLRDQYSPNHALSQPPLTSLHPDQFEGASTQHSGTATEGVQPVQSSSIQPRRKIGGLSWL